MGRRIYQPLTTTHPRLAALIDEQRSGITADQLTAGSNRIVWWRCPEHPDKEHQAAVHNHIRRPAGCTCKRQASQNKALSVADNLVLTALWDHSRNTADPSQVRAGSEKLLHWKCASGHTWTASAYNAARLVEPCPQCRGAMSALGSVADTAKLAALWDTERNPEGSARTATIGSGVPFWWLCPAGHSWQQTPAAVHAAEQPCPTCRHPKIADNPKLAALWHPTRNLPVTADQIAANTSRPYWWRCTHAKHVWQANPGRVGTQPIPCPECRNSRTQAVGQPDPNGNRRYLSLAASHRLIAAVLDEERSGFTAHQISAGSGKTAWWLCDAHPDHPFPMVVKDRVKRPDSCPVCAGRQVLPGFNDLASLHPDIAATLDTERSGFTADQVTAGSNRYAWWTCPQHPGHPWRTKVNNRVTAKGCALCAPHLDKARAARSGRPSAGATLTATHPELAATLDTARSGFAAEQVSAGSGRVAWWTCPEHPAIPFRMNVYRRTSGQQCPICAGQQVAAGVNDLATLRPDIASMLDEQRSGFTATQVTVKSNRRGWWTVDGQPRRTSIANMTSRLVVSAAA